MNNITVRETLTPEDLPAIASILHRTKHFTIEEIEIGLSLLVERIKDGLESGYYFLIAELDKKVIGYACYGPIPMTTDGIDLYWIAVDPDYQSQGIGSLLLKHTERKARNLGGIRLYAETSSKELYHSTQLFYEHHSFILEARQKDYYAPGDDRLMYVKVLTGA